MATIRDHSISIGGEGYLHGSKPDTYEYADHSYFYKIYVQARSSKGFKIKWSHLDTHYRYWRYLDNKNSEKLDKIQLELENKTYKSWNIKLLAGHLDNFTFAQGLTFDSHYNYGYVIQLKKKAISFETSYLHTSIHLDGFLFNRLNLFNSIGFSLIYIQDINNYHHYMPGFDFSYSIFKSGLTFVGEVRQNYIDQSHPYHLNDTDILNKSAYLAGMKFNIYNNQNDMFNINLSVRRYGKGFNNNYNRTSHYTSFQYRSPEVLHVKYDNWLHYLFLPGASRGFSISSKLQKKLIDKIIIKNDFEWASQKWLDASYKKKLTLFDLSISYPYDNYICFCSGITNKVLNNFNIPYNSTAEVKNDSYYYSSPLFINTKKIVYYFKISFKF